MSEQRVLSCNRASSNLELSEAVAVVGSQIADIKKAAALAESRLMQIQSSGSVATVVDARLIRRVCKARRHRELQLGPNLFSDPAWDILLEAFAADLEQRTFTVSAMCAASNVPPTTALRWLKKLEDDNWLEREADAYDSRRIWIRLTDEAALRLRTYFEGVAHGLFLL